MKNAIVLGSLLIAGLSPLAASAADKSGLYASVNGLAVFSESSKDTYDNGFFSSDLSFDQDPGVGVGAALGYDFAGSGLRLEGELTYRYNKMELTESDAVFSESENRNVHSLALMANAYYDFDTNSKFTPYIGVGLGSVTVDVETFRDTVFAYQGMLGTAYNLDDRSEIYAGYRYFGSKGLEDDYNIKMDVASHNAEVGYRIRF